MQAFLTHHVNKDCYKIDTNKRDIQMDNMDSVIHCFR